MTDFFDTQNTLTLDKNCEETNRSNAINSVPFNGLWGGNCVWYRVFKFIHSLKLPHDVNSSLNANFSSIRVEILIY